MVNVSVCCTLFVFGDREELAARYEETAEPANGYLTSAGDVEILVDAEASETANWSRQTELAAEMTAEDEAAISIFIVGDSWALAVAYSNAPGPVAVCQPENPKAMEKLPYQLMEFKSAVEGVLPGMIDSDRLDCLLGAVLEGVTPVDEVADELVAMLGGSPDWQRWSWFETIPEALILDPDLASRVTPLGAAKELWEE